MAIGHDTRMVLSHCRSQCCAHHTGVTLLGLEGGGSRGCEMKQWRVALLSRQEGEKQRAQIIKVKPEAVGRAENRTGVALLPVSLLQDCLY